MRIRTRFFLAFLVTGLSVVLITALLAAAGFSRGLDQYLGQRRVDRLEVLVEQFGAYYEMHRRWPAQFERVPGIRSGHFKGRGLVLLDRQRKPVIGEPERNRRYLSVPVMFDGAIVGYLAHPHSQPNFDPIDENFRNQQFSYLLLASALALLIALLVSWLLARQLVRPILRVAGFSKHLAAGDYDKRLPAGRTDELGELMTAINHLAEALGQAEHARDRWLADISHELRTPIAILQGEIEALIDGIRQPDSARLNSLHQEVKHLQKLLNDLHTLALADAGTLRYHFEPTDLAAIARSQTDLFERPFASAGLRLETDLPAAAMLRGDPERLRQLVANLLSNSLKYTRPEGVVRVSLSKQGKHWRLIIADSAPGVPLPERRRLFERLYRVESSRNRSEGGSGLGLAICQRIVEAHGGEITATEAELGGLKIDISLPEEQL
tara:strand:- start:932 stop:2245 length:1314 start_codon:yes stop_codon:yes gene_type:complete